MKLMRKEDIGDLEKALKELKSGRTVPLEAV